MPPKRGRSPARSRAAHWSPKEVAVFLREEGFTDYADKFLEQEIDGASLGEMTERFERSRMSSID